NVFDDVDEDIETDDVCGTEGSGFWPADGGAGAGIDFFDGHAERLHEAQRVEHRKSANAIGDKIRRILRGDDTFGEAVVAEFGKRGENLGKSLGAGNDFNQL